VAIGVLAGLLLAEFVIRIQTLPEGGVGFDYRFFVGISQRWLADGSYYLPRQLEGVPYAMLPVQDVMYPPSALFLFVPFAFLPAVLWWAIPIAVTLYVVRWLKPAPWAVCVMLVLLMWPRAIGAYVYANTDIWMAAFVAAGLRWGWPAVMLTLKPTLAPLALIGIRQRSWWVALAVLALVSFPMLPLWLDYLVAVRNIQIALDYSLGSVPLIVMPLVAWLGRDRSRTSHWPAPRRGSSG
jgi:hypothetical protein